MKQAKLKAFELFDEHRSLIPITDKYPDCDKIHIAHEGARNRQAKDHAIILCNEKINEFTEMSNNIMGLSFQGRVDYWMEVKKEIEYLNP